MYQKMIVTCYQMKTKDSNNDLSSMIKSINK